MILTKTKALLTALLVTGALLLSSSAVLAQGAHRRGGRLERPRPPHGRVLVAPRPPLVVRPLAAPRAHAVAIPRVIHEAQRRAYAPYYAGRVYYEPLWTDLDVYYFPIRRGGSVVVEPCYYFNGELFFTSAYDGPTFYLHVGF
jgi:hypothetical protein